MEKTVVPLAAGGRPPGGPKLIFRTEHYRVVVGIIHDLPETATVMRQRYIIDCPEDGVIYGLAATRPAAIVAAKVAEKEWQELDRMLAEEAAREASENDGTAFPSIQ